MSSNEISVTNSQWYFYSVFPLWKRQTNLISCHFKTLTSKKCIIQFHTQGLRHALHILSSKTNAIRILNQIKHKWQSRAQEGKGTTVFQIMSANTSRDLVPTPDEMKLCWAQSEGWVEFEISYLAHRLCVDCLDWAEVIWEHSGQTVMAKVQFTVST